MEELFINEALCFQVVVEAFKLDGDGYSKLICINPILKNWKKKQVLKILVFIRIYNIIL